MRCVKLSIGCMCGVTLSLLHICRSAPSTTHCSAAINCRLSLSAERSMSRTGLAALNNQPLLVVLRIPAQQLWAVLAEVKRGVGKHPNRTTSPYF
ncbi:hypothetical protein V8C37DRAFT_384078 [Trichoderma ceciliae]